MKIITQPKQLQELCTRIDAHKLFALDLEFIPERTYQPILCLVQVAVHNEAFIIDPLQCTELNSLWQRVADPQIQTVLHAAVQDLDLIFRSSSLLPANVFDTQIAAGFVGFGFPIGYAKLLQQLLGITIPKTESFSDWLERPLSDSQLKYAVEDVNHLLSLADKLKQALNKLGRLGWVQEECERYCQLEQYAKESRQEITRVKGASSLNRRGLAVLQELCILRGSEASRHNRPLKSILSDTVLLELSRRPPKHLSEIQRVRGIRPDQVKQIGDKILSSIQLALSLSDADCPNWPGVRPPPKNEVILADMLYSMLKIITYDAEIATELVATRDDVQHFVRKVKEDRIVDDSFPLLTGWRAEIAGTKLRQIVQHGGFQVRFQMNEQNPVQLILPDSFSA